MTEAYARARRVAVRLLTTRGGDAELVTEVQGEGDPWNLPPPTIELLTVRMVETGYRVGWRDGTTIEAGDKLGVFTCPASVTPSPGDKIRINGVDYTMMDVQPVQPAPGDEIVVYQFQARI